MLSVAGEFLTPLILVMLAFSGSDLAFLLQISGVEELRKFLLNHEENERYKFANCFCVLLLENENDFRFV